MAGRVTSGTLRRNVTVEGRRVETFEGRTTGNRDPFKGLRYGKRSAGGTRSCRRRALLRRPRRRRRFLKGSLPSLPPIPPFSQFPPSPSSHALDPLLAIYSETRIKSVFRSMYPAFRKTSETNGQPIARTHESRPRDPRVHPSIPSPSPPPEHA